MDKDLTEFLIIAAVIVILSFPVASWTSKKNEGFHGYMFNYVVNAMFLTILYVVCLLVYRWLTI